MANNITLAVTFVRMYAPAGTIVEINSNTDGLTILTGAAEYGVILNNEGNAYLVDDEYAIAYVGTRHTAPRDLARTVARLI